MWSQRWLSTDTLDHDPHNAVDRFLDGEFRLRLAPQRFVRTNNAGQAKTGLLTSGMRWVLIYELVDDYLERRVALREEHLRLARAAHDRGELLLAGALADPHDRALLVFAGDGPDIATAFALADPYVIRGLVTSWTVRQWDEVLEAR